MIHYLKNIIFLFGLLFLSSCGIEMKIDIQNNIEDSNSEINIIIENNTKKELTGWWVYGENQHIFKDEKTLEEFDLEFPNEDPKEIIELYLAICEMEYFPMECRITAYKKKDIFKNQTTLMVSKLEILYVEGCGE